MHPVVRHFLKVYTLILLNKLTKFIDNKNQNSDFSAGLFPQTCFAVSKSDSICLANVLNFAWSTMLSPFNVP